MNRRVVVGVALAALSLLAGARAQVPASNPLLDEFAWRPVGPVNMGGRVDDVEAVESDPSIIYVGAATSKSVMIGLIILLTSTFFVPLHIEHPFWMLVFLLLTALTFCLFGFLLGIWATSWEKLQFVPLLVITPLTFLGGAFYSIDMLPAPWRTVTLFNPVVYLISGFRWSFFGKSDVDVVLSFSIILVMLVTCLALISWMIRTGWRMRH